MDKLLKLYTYVDGANDTPFPNESEQIIIGSFQYDANRMGGAPTITATVKHRLCLDDLWTDKVYATFKGEKYFVKNTPSSSKSNDDARYEHSVELLSEREILNHVYFIDAVQGDSSIDIYKSNSTTVVFFGDITEFVSRLNASLSYFGLDYTVVIDEGITSEEKQVSITDKYFLSALQEIFNIYELAYYFVGKTIHVGFTENAITFPMAYGADGALLSISKENANYQIINSITGVGSTDNIPYYYPNESDDRNAIISSGKKWITPQANLMPPVYRESEGADMFYDAKNNTYPDPEGGYYEFENEYSEDNPQQGKVSFPEIKPTIKGMTNAAGQRIDTFIEFAYDRDDNEDFDPDNNNEYLHPYFFAKLRKTDGSNGFNLFDHAIENQPMQISMTSGICGACTFEIGVGEETQKNIVQVDDNGNLKRDENGNVIRSGEPQDRQNNTQTNEVWIALRKDDSTYAQLMPNKEYNYRPSTNDTFVILGINLPQGYITRAEQELEDSLIKHMWMNNREKFNFSIKFSRIFFAEHPEVLEQLNENARLLIEYNNQQFTFYVDGFSYKMDSNIPLPEVSVDLVETLTVGQNSLQNALDSVKQDILSSIGGADFLKQGLKYFIRKDISDYVRGITTFLNGLRIKGKYISDIIMSPEQLEETDDVIMSVLKAVNTFIRKDKADATNFLLKLVGGAEFGNYEAGKSGGKVDAQGAAELLSLLVQGLVTASGIESADFSTGALGTGFTLKIDENGDSYIEVDRMLVRKVATFVQLLIQKIRAVGGQIILSPASMNCSRVEEHDTFYRCYFENTDGEKTIAQEFVVGDQARCQTFNVKEGVNENVTNTYYWRLVVGVGDDYIDLSKTDCDAGSTVPQAGDDIVQLGNRTDATRQAAIVLAAYGNDAPYFKMYRGIDSYSLSGKEFISFSRTEVMIIADSLRFSTGESVKDYIDNATGNAITGVDVEYALGDSPTEAPQTGWSTTAPEWQVGKYMWQRTKTTTSKGSSYSEPTCIQGAKGDKGDQGLQGLQGEKGEQGIPGTPGKDGADGKTLYTWIRYADDAQGNGMSNDPTGKAFIGFAYNKDTATESDNPADYAWSDIKGEQGVKGDKGEDGTQYYTWIKYSDNADGSEMYDTPKSTTQYIGIAVNKTSPTESNTPTDYTWSKFKGDKGDQGPQGIPGADGADGRTSYFHIKYSSKANPTSAADMTETPSEYIGTYVDYTAADSTDPSDYTWSRFQGIQGEKGDQGIPGTSGEDGKTYYLHIAYANSADGSQGFSTTDSANKLYIGQYTDTTQADSTDYKKYSWTKIKGDTGKGVSALEEQYYLSTSNTTQTGGSWQTTCPAWESGKYIWTRTKVTWTDNTVTYTTPVLAEDINDLGAKLEQAISDLAENIDFVNSLSEELETVKDQVDGAIETWFYAPVPTLTNAPASSWTTTELKNQHLGDLYYDGNGKAYRFQMSGSNYVWQVITDTDITKALANAQKAQDTADGKRRVFVTTPTNASAYDVGDLWVNATYGSYSNDLLRCKTAKAAGAAWNISHWEKASKYTDDTKANQAIADAAEALAAANDAQDTANAAKERLDGWAADNVISPAEKQALKDEIARIDGDKSEITANYTKYGLGTPTAYNNAHSAYRAVLVTLSAATPETITIPSDFATKQTAYYTARTDALTAIADAAKAYVDSIEIGARNYILNTGKAYSFTGKNVSNQVGFGGWVLKKEAATIGDYIFTVKLKFENCTFVDESVCWFQTNNNNGWGYTMLAQTRKTVKENGEYTFQGRYTWNKADVTGNAQIGFRVDYVGGGTVTVSEMRLYKGTKDVGWTPAPEDAENSLNDYKEEVEAKFEATNESITAAVESAKSYTDEKGEHILSETTSMINVAKNDISLSVDTKINNLQIGGRNYFGFNKGVQIAAINNISSTREFDQSIKGAKVTLKADAPSSAIMFRIQYLGMLEKGYYTFSAYMKADRACTIDIDICDASPKATVDLTTNYQRVVLTANATSHLSDDSYRGFVDFTVPRGGSIPSGTVFYLKEIKIEKGTKATDWTPAPEDTDASITELSSRIEVTEESIKNTVSKTEFDALGNTVSSHTSQITQLNNQISSKVSSSELTEKLKGYVTTTTYNNKMSSIDQSLSSITSRVSSTETEINTIDGELQDITERVSAAELKITPDAICATVESQTTQIANNAVAGLEIGGRNLYKRTKSVVLSDWKTNGSAVSSYDTTQAVDGFTVFTIRKAWQGLYQDVPLEAGQTYVLSAWVKGDGAAHVNRYGENCTFGAMSFTQNAVAPSQWTRFWFAFTVTGGTSWKPRFENSIDGASISYYGFKLEKGTKPTDWTPAPEDYSTTSEIKSSFKMTATGISLLGQDIALTGKVTFSMLASDAQGKVNTAQQTADSAQTAANTANTGLASLKNSLGDMAYRDKVSDAMLDETVIVGGFIKTDLIDVDNLYVRHLQGATGDFTGEVSATSGQIGNWIIDDGALRSSDFDYPSSPTSGDGAGSRLSRSGLMISCTGEETGVLVPSSGSKLAACIVAKGENSWVQGAYIGAHCSSTSGYLSQVVALELSATNAYSSTPMNTPIALKIANGFPDIPGVLLAGYVYSSGTSSKYKYGKKRTTSGAYQSTYGYGGVKQYQIIHNLGHSNYVVLVTPVSIGASWRKYHAHIVSQGPSDFFVAFIDSGTEGTLVQSDFMFAMIGNNT